MSTATVGTRNNTDYPSRLTEFLKKSATESPNSILFEYQQYVYDYMTRVDTRGILLFHSVGSGKCMAYNTPVLMHDGSIRKIQDIKVGECVMGDDSTPRVVLSLARGVDTMYNVWYEGRKYTVNKEHILCLKKVDKTLNVVSSDVECITVSDFVQLTREEQQSYRGYRNVISLEHRQVESMDVYTTAKMLVSEVDIAGNAGRDILVNSPDVQLQAIAGIVDVLGHVVDYKGFDAIELFMSSEIKPLMDNLLFACHSRGILNRCRKIRNAYKITLFGEVLADLPLRVLMVPEPSADSCRSGYSIRVKKFKIDNYYGFCISGNRRYVLADCSVTHNTMTSISIAEHFRMLGSKVVVLSSKALQLNYKKEIAAYHALRNKQSGVSTSVESQESVIDSYDFVTSNARNMVKRLKGGEESTDDTHVNSSNEITVNDDNELLEELAELTTEPVSGELAELTAAINEEHYTFDGAADVDDVGEEQTVVDADANEEPTGVAADANEEPTVVAVDVDDTNKEQTDADEEQTDADEEPTNVAADVDDTNEEPTDADEEPTVVAVDVDDTNEEPTDADADADDEANVVDDQRNIDNVLKFLTQQTLEDKVIIVDEAHNLFNSISNGSKVANEFYDMVMNTKKCKLIFLTGTPIINDPFEIAVCFNMLVGKLDSPMSSSVRQKSRRFVNNKGMHTTILPEHYVDFTKYFVDRSNNDVANYDKLRNRIYGLTSYYGDMYTRPFESVETELGKSIHKENYPVRLPLKFEICKMSVRQHADYMEAREKERKENWFKATSGGDVSGGAIVVESSGASTSYRIRSRQLSNVYIPSETKATPLPLDVASPKMSRILRNIEATTMQIHLVYSTFLKYGIGYLAKELESRGWTKFSDAPNVTQHKDKTFALFSGEQTMEEKQAILQACRSPKNAHGERIRVLLISKSGTEGLDLKNVRSVHIMEPYWNFSLIQQVIARGVRYKSHDDLPEQERNVQTFVYLSDYNPSSLKEMKMRNAMRRRKEVIEQTTDVHMFKNAVKNQDLVQKFLRCIASASIECPLMNKNMLQCFGCASTGKPLYHNDVKLDLETSNNCKQTTKVSAEEVIIDGRHYWYAVDAKTGLMRVFAAGDGKAAVELHGEHRDVIARQITQQTQSNK